MREFRGERAPSIVCRYGPPSHRLPPDQSMSDTAATSTLKGYIPTLDRQGRQDITAAARDLGYAPRWTLEDGVRAYADHLRAHPH